MYVDLIIASSFAAVLKTMNLHVLRRLSTPHSAAHLRGLIWIQLSTPALTKKRRLMKGTEEQNINVAVSGKRSNPA